MSFLTSRNESEPSAVPFLLTQSALSSHQPKFTANVLTPLYIHFADTKKTVKAPTKLWVDTNIENGYVPKRLAKMLGEENVVIK